MKQLPLAVVVGRWCDCCREQQRHWASATLLGVFFFTDGNMGTMEYTPGIVSELLRFAYDEQHTWGVRIKDSSEPDPGMPRSPSDPAAQGTMWAMCADCQRAFESLKSQKVRDRVWNRYVIGHSPVDIAAAAGVTVKAVEKSLYEGVRDMVEFLNGKPWVDAKKSLAPADAAQGVAA